MRDLWFAGWDLPAGDGDARQNKHRAVEGEQCNDKFCLMDPAGSFLFNVAR